MHGVERPLSEVARRAARSDMVCGGVGGAVRWTVVFSLEAHAAENKGGKPEEASRHNINCTNSSLPSLVAVTFVLLPQGLWLRGVWYYLLVAGCGWV